MKKPHDENDEVVAYVGFAVHDPVFRGLPKHDQDAIHALAAEHMDLNHQFRLILRSGQIAGYGIAVIIADQSEVFGKMDEGTLVAQVQHAKTVVRQLTHTVGRMEPSLYVLQSPAPRP